jgi:hypothetical protein
MKTNQLYNTISPEEVAVEAVEELWIPAAEVRAAEVRVEPEHRLKVICRLQTVMWCPSLQAEVEAQGVQVEQELYTKTVIHMHLQVVVELVKIETGKQADLATVVAVVAVVVEGRRMAGMLLNGVKVSGVKMDGPVLHINRIYLVDRLFLLQNLHP